MTIDKKALRNYSMLGERGAFFSRLTELAGEIENLALLTADLGVLSGLGRFMRDHSDKFYNVGIAEQNMIGIAAGMAKVGLNVFATTYSTFITMRSFEQIRMNLGYMQFPIKIVGSGAGMVMSMSGISHYSFEDIAIMRSVPNMIVVSPADAFEAVKVVDALIKFNKPTYIRLTGGLGTPMIYTQDYDLEIGKGVVLKDGTDVTIFSTGTMAAPSLKAAELLEDENISVAVVNLHTIKPLDSGIVDEYSNNRKLIVTVEEHSIIGGLGGAIAENNACRRYTPPLLRLGIPDNYCKAGSYDYLLGKCGLTAEKIATKIKNDLYVD